MKRNETVLVYAVTGLLLVILLVAVVFGEQNPAKAQGFEKMRPQVASLPGVTPADSPADGSAENPAKKPAETTADDKAKTGDDAEKGAPTTGPPNAEAKVEAPETETKATQNGDDRGVGLSANVITPAKQIEGVLGVSTRSGEFRVVKARRGDTLARLVARWCLDAAHLATVEVLNESLVDAALTSGQEVVVPWIDAEALLAAETSRKKQAAVIEHAKGQPYILKRGDSLWNLAKVRVAKNMIPAWLERFKQLNPEITDPSALIAGQKVRLPR
jgi:LysM domain